MNGWIFLNFYRKQEMDKEKCGELKPAVITHLFHLASDLNFPVGFQGHDCHITHIWSADINFHAHAYLCSYLKTEPWLQQKPVSRWLFNYSINRSYFGFYNHNQFFLWTTICLHLQAFSKTCVWISSSWLGVTHLVLHNRNIKWVNSSTYQ